MPEWVRVGEEPDDGVRDEGGEVKAVSGAAAERLPDVGIGTGRGKEKESGRDKTLDEWLGEEEEESESEEGSTEEESEEDESEVEESEGDEEEDRLIG